MTTVYLIRHAEAQANVDRVFQGHMDGPLSENGKLQLEYLQRRFRKIPLSKIYTSPLKRTVETAKAVNRFLELPLVMEPALLEIYGGMFEGQKFSTLPNKFPDEWEDWTEMPHLFHAPMGDSMRAVQDRMRAAILRIAHDNMGKTVGVVSHGCAIRAFLCYANGMPFDLLDEIPWGDNTCVSKIVFDHRFEPHVEYMNDNVHLPEDVQTISKQQWWWDKNAMPEDKEEKLLEIPAGELYVKDDDMHIAKARVLTGQGEFPLRNTKLHIEEGTVYLQNDRIKLTESKEQREDLIKLEESGEELVHT